MGWGQMAGTDNDAAEDDGRRSVGADDLEQRAAIGRLIREWRKDRDLTQSDIAAAIGVGQSFVVKLEKGEKPLSLKHLWALAAYLGEHPGDVLKGPGASSDEPRLSDVSDPQAREFVRDIIRRYADEKK